MTAGLCEFRTDCAFFEVGIHGEQGRIACIRIAWQAALVPCSGQWTVLLWRQWGPRCCKMTRWPWGTERPPEQAQRKQKPARTFLRRTAQESVPSHGFADCSRRGRRPDHAAGFALCPFLAFAGTAYRNSLCWQDQCCGSVYAIAVRSIRHRLPFAYRRTFARHRDNQWQNDVRTSAA